MNVGGWLTFLVHVLIIIIHFIIKKPLHFLIVFSVFLLFITQLYLLMDKSLASNNLTFFKNYEKVCVDNDIISSNNKYVILRLDGLQSDNLRNISIKMIDEWIGRKIPFTLGIKPLELRNDQSISSYLKRNRCFFEIAQYWYNNREDFPEFRNISELVADSKFTEGLEILSEYSDKKIITFVAPSDMYSMGTVKSANKHDFNVISWEWDWLFDYSITHFNYSTSKLNSINSILEKANNEVSYKWFTIIKLNPQDYLDELWNIDYDKFNEYISLLDSLKSNWFTFTTIDKYYNYLNKSWLKTNFFYKSVKKAEFKDSKIQLTDTKKTK